MVIGFILEAGEDSYQEKQVLVSVMDISCLETQWLNGEKSACSAEDIGSIPGSR